MEIIRKHGFTTRKRFGQNFLIDEHVIEKIMEATALTDEDCALEIGPGIGALTQRLAERARHVVAVEIDQNLIPILQETLSGYSNVTVIHQDILKTDLKELAETYNDGKRLKVVANLPYYITTPIVMQLLESGAPIDSMTLMVQKEVADRMEADPGTRDYGALSLAVQYYTKVTTVATVPPGCFIPQPKVTSAVVHMVRRTSPVAPVADEGFFFRVVRAAFGQRRKTLPNALCAGINGLTRDVAVECMAAVGLDEKVRGGKLSTAEFAALSCALWERLNS